MLASRALGAALIALCAAACGPAAPKFQGSDVTGVSFGRDFHLTDHTGKPRTLADFRGKAVVIFFGYTQCPDYCPTTLSELAAAMTKLGPDAARVQVLFVTVDPERDTAELLSRYVPALRRRGGDGSDREGIQGPVSEAAGADTRNLYDGPLRGHVHLRSAGALARVRKLRAGTGRARARHSPAPRDLRLTWRRTPHPRFSPGTDATDRPGRLRARRAP
jgi:hypothetical protein